MNRKLIMLSNPILVGGEIKGGDFYFKDDKILQWVKGTSVTYSHIHPSDYPKPIIAGIEGLPKLDLSLIAERIGWVDVEKLAYAIYPINVIHTDEWKPIDLNLEKRLAFIVGYTKSQSLNEKKFSEEDVRHIIRQAIWHTARFGEDALKREESILHSIKPKEYQVEVEMEEGEVWNGLDTQKYRRIKITNNTIKVLKIL